MASELSRKVTALYRQGRQEEAQELLQEATRIDPETSQDFLKRGTACSFLGRREEAMADFEKAIKLDPRNAEAHMRRAHILLNTDKPEEALAVYEEVIELTLDDPEGYRSKGNALFALKRFDELLAYYQELINRFPDQRDFWNLAISGVLSQLGKYDEALKIIDEISDPFNLEPLPSYSYYLHRAGVLALLKQFDEALDSLAEGMKVTKKEAGCVPCFVGNCWRVPYFDSLRKPPYRQRLEAIIGPKPKVSKGKRSRS